MKIKRITDQIRRDFSCIYICEHCGNEEEGGGYDDDHFHRYVIPMMKCVACGKKASEDYRPMGTKYPANQVV
jgi:DNA-directed RNA polymerase subunit RPC12/RpoP